MGGRVDLLFDVSGRLVVTEWKFYRAQYLNVPVPDDINKSDDVVLAKADALLNYNRDGILELKFESYDKFHRGTIRSQVMKYDAPQLRWVYLGGLW